MMLGRVAENWLKGWLSRMGGGQSPGATAQPTPWVRNEGERLLLHIGCGHAYKQDTVPGFFPDGWREIRLDANPAVGPDIVSDMRDMCLLPDGAVDAVFSAHNIEHLYWHDIGVALAEFHRVLADDGFLVLTCPDLQAVARMIADDRLLDTAYVSPAGPVTPYDIVYGMRKFCVEPPHFMAHRAGFTRKTLLEAVQAAGFKSCYGTSRSAELDLWVVATKASLSPEALRAFVPPYLPSNALD